MTKRGVFIVFEGIDASGKTLHLKTISQELRKQGYNILLTKEPSKDLVGDFIHRYAQQQRSRLLPETEVLLFVADRFEHVKKIIEPALKRGRIVMSDRYFYSTLAYQGASGADLDWIREMNWYAPKPDLCILFDILPDYSLHRTKRKRTLFEDANYLRKVRNIYLSLVEQEGLIKINADRPKREIHEEVSSIVRGFLETRDRQQIAPNSSF